MSDRNIEVGFAKYYIIFDGDFHIPVVKGKIFLDT
jgi:hypothetical protein